MGSSCSWQILFPFCNVVGNHNHAKFFSEASSLVKYVLDTIIWKSHFLIMHVGRLQCYNEWMCLSGNHAEIAQIAECSSSNGKVASSILVRSYFRIVGLKTLLWHIQPSTPVFCDKYGGRNILAKFLKHILFPCWINFGEQYKCIIGKNI